MLYFRSSALKDADIDEAKTIVLSIINNRDTFTSHLISREDWVQALQAKFPEEFQKIVDQKDLSLKEEDYDFEQIQHTYNRALSKLTLITLS